MLCAQPLQRFTLAHTHAIKYLQLTESRAIQVLQDCTAGALDAEGKKTRGGSRGMGFDMV